MYELHFMHDLLIGLKTFSTMAQKSAGLLIGKESFRRDLINFIEELKDKDGVKMQWRQ